LKLDVTKNHLKARYLKEEKMNKLKRVMAILLIGLMMIGVLWGCQGKENTSNESDESQTNNEETVDAQDTPETSDNSGGQESMTMILAERDEFLSTLESGALETAKELGIKLNTADAQADTSKMLQFIESARNNGEKAVIINMVDPTTAQQCIEAAGDMKVVFVNRAPEDTSVLNENVAYVGSDENVSGKFQGDWLAEYFKEQGKAEIKYILLNGILGNVSTTLRSASAIQALEDNGIAATEATAPLVADWARATAQDMITPLLTTIEYDCIISNNDAMALGAIEGLIAEGIDPSTIPVVGIDATEDGRQAVKDGIMAMTVFQDPVGQGRGAMLAAQNLIEGNSINEGTDYDVDETGYIVWVPFELVTPENVADYDNK